MILRILIFSSALWILTGCGHTKPTPQLQNINDLTETNPQRALDSLANIDPLQLDTYNLHYYKLLRLKAADKAYINHVSDSTLLEVLSYFNHHHTEHYPEALYYGGRVYSDLGDYPTALNYFQKALDAIPNNDEAANLRACINSQSGRLLNRLRLYSQAIPYLQAALAIERSRNDTTGLMWDHELIVDTYLGLREFNKAKAHRKSAIITRQ